MMTQTQAEKNAYLRAWRAKNAESIRLKRGPGTGYYRKYHTARYGMTPAEYDEFLLQPCAICGESSEVVDHNHETGEVRGPLCSRCNKGLGLFRDNPEYLVKASAYVQRRGGK